jgi:ribosome-interacting GTPase 1
MPTNLPAEAKHKWKEVALAKRPKEKITRLQEFLSLVPKHKGTENLRGQVKRKIALLREEIVEKKRRRSGGRSKHFFEREGDAQIIIFGPTNVGRSSLLRILTNAKVEVSDYPYTTTQLTPGMFQYQDLQLQLVEAPALMEGSSNGGAWGLQSLSVARNSDCLLLMVDLSRDPVEQLSLVSRELEKARIHTRKTRAEVGIEKKHRGTGLKIIITGHLIECSLEDVEELVKGYGIHDAIVKIQGKATIDDVEDAIFENTVHKPAIIIANKTDVPNADGRMEQLRGFLKEEMGILPISCKTEYGLEKLGSEIFNVLNVVRVYTKEPDRRAPSEHPFTVRKGSTVLDLAKQIHSDFYTRFSYAKVWSERLPFSPQRVGGTFTLEDGDVVEIHVK